MPKVAAPGIPVGVVRTYANMLIVNGIVLVPIYRQETSNQDEALAIIQDAFSGKKVVGIYADDIARMYGSIHCATQTVPLD